MDRIKKMKTYKITSLGCKVNQCESDAISSLLNKEGLVQSDGKNADICIINTCTVTQKASMQSRQAVRRAIKDHPSAKIVVTGCYAQIQPDEIIKIKGVHDVIGNSHKNKICEILKSDYPHNTPGLFRENIFDQRVFDDYILTSVNKKTRPFLKIQDGCEAFCTYCIVPFTRGPSCSMSFDKVLKAIKRLSDQGYSEVVLTGIHLGHYGLDLKNKTNLYNLLKKIDSEKLIKRVRLSSIEPNELSDEILNLISKSEIICNHFHISIQSADDEILKRMHRPYNSNDVLKLINKIIDLMPDAGIGADFLIGFPGETDSSFEKTYSFIKEAPLTYLHVFPYSPRKKTIAYNFTNQIDFKVKKIRCKKIRMLGEIKKEIFYKKALGRKEHVLIETSNDKKTGMLKGFTSNYIKILLSGDDMYKNKLTLVKILKYDDKGLFGIVNDEL